MIKNKYKDDIEESRLRVEAWWNHELLDRPPLLLRFRKPAGASGICERANDESHDEAALERAYTDPGVAIPAAKRWIESQCYEGEAFPVMCPVASVAITGNYLGCPLHLAQDTAWSDPIIDDWESRPVFRFDPANKWWKATERVLAAGVEQSDGYFVSLPDLNGPTQILAQLRSMDRLLLDFYDNPEQIKPALREINDAWFQYWDECTRITQPLGGFFNWMGIWSDKPATDLQSDVSCMMSREFFDEYFLPFIEEQTERIERTVYHLDGEGAIRHLDSLLKLPKLTAIQWVAGAGAKPAVEWIPLMKKIQAAGKLVFTYCLKEDVQRLLEELDPAALLLQVDGVADHAEAEKLIADARSR